MIEASLHSARLPLRHVWTISHGTRTEQHNLIVALHDRGSGLTGYGEAPGIPYMGATVEDMVGRVKWNDPHLKRCWVDAVHGSDGSKNPMESPAWQEMTLAEGLIPSGRFVRAAMDQAVLDLWGKTHGRTVRSLWAAPSTQGPASDYTIGLADPASMVAKIQEFPDFPVYKIKLGSSAEQGGTVRDLQIIRHLREATDRPFRVDANTAWTAEQTLELAAPLRDLGVQFIEQPLKPNLPRSEHEAVYFGCDLPVIADESCQTESDVERCAGLFHGINIKLSKCGGMTPARRMIDRARKLRLSVMMGCMTESTVGISALAQFLPLLDDVDMDGALLLAEDVADGVKLQGNGIARFPAGGADVGNGVRLTRTLDDA